MWEALLWFGVGWWVGTNKALGQPIIPPEVASAPTVQDAVTAAADDVAAAIQQQAGGAAPADTGVSSPPLVASGQLAPDMATAPGATDTGYTVNGRPVCVDSFMNLVDCTTGQPLSDDEAQIIINTLQPVGRQGAPDATGTMGPPIYVPQPMPVSGYGRWGRLGYRR